MLHDPPLFNAGPQYTKLKASKPLRLEQGQGSGLGPPDNAVFPGNTDENSRPRSLGPLALPEHKILHMKNSFM